MMKLLSSFWSSLGLLLLVQLSLHADLPQALDNLRGSLENLSMALQGGKGNVSKGKIPSVASQAQPLDVTTQKQLIGAIKNKDIAAVKKMLPMPSKDINFRLGIGEENPLQTALERGALDIAQYLVDNGADVDFLVDQSNGRTLLMDFAQRGRVQEVRFLLDNNVNKDITDRTRFKYKARDYPSEHFGATKEQIEEIQKLLSDDLQTVTKPTKVITTGSTHSDNSTNFKYPTFKDWYEACQDLPLHSDMKEIPLYISNEDYFLFNKDKANPEDKKYIEKKKNILSYDELIRVSKEMQELFKKEFVHASKWLNGKVPMGILEQDIKPLDMNLFEPFVLKRLSKEDIQYIIQGDRHGDVHSVLHFIQEMQHMGYIRKNSFEISNKSMNFIFLGDTIDRGVYSLEVIYTLSRFKLANPDNVFIIRGNNEDWNIAQRYGLSKEIAFAFPEDGSKRVEIQNVCIKYFNLLPSALYLGCNDNYVQCCHGGIEIGYNPKALLNSDAIYEYIDKVEREKNIEAVGLKSISGTNWLFEAYIESLKQPLSVKNIGLTWSDFMPQPGSLLIYEKSRGVSFGQICTEKYIDFVSTGKSKLQGFLRAHQHAKVTSGSMMEKILNPDTPGLAKIWEITTDKNKNKLWNNSVCTFNIAPHTNVGQASGYFKNYGTMKGVIKDFWGLLTLANNFADWTIEMHEINHIEQPQKVVKSESVPTFEDIGNALQKNDFKKAEELLSFSKNLINTLRVSNNESLLIQFVDASNEPVVRFLLEHGADPFDKDLRGNTVLEFAKQRQQDKRIVDLIEEYQKKIVDLNKK